MAVCQCLTEFVVNGLLMFMGDLLGIPKSHHYELDEENSENDRHQVLSSVPGMVASTQHSIFSLTLPSYPCSRQGHVASFINDVISRLK